MRRFLTLLSAVLPAVGLGGSSVLAAEFRPSNGAELVAAVASARTTIEPDVITLTPKVHYTVAPHAAYRVALILDGINGLTIESPKGTPRLEWPWIELAGGDYAGKAIVLFGSGRTAGTSSIAIHRVVLDGADNRATNEDTQQSTLFRATSVAGLELEDVAIQNVAADGLKLGGSARYGSTRRVRIAHVTSSDCGRATIVLQSLVEDVEIRNLVTQRQRKGAIDVEATLVGFPGPRNVRIFDSQLLSGAKADGSRPEYGLSLGGADYGEGLMRDVLIANVTVDSGIWARNAVDLTFVGVVVDAPRFGLTLDKRVALDWHGGSINGKLGAVLSQHHGTPGAVPDGVLFSRAALDSPAGTPTVQVVSGTNHVFEQLTWGASNQLVLVNELKDQPMGGFAVRGTQPKVRVAARNDRPTSPIAPVVFVP